MVLDQRINYTSERTGVFFFFGFLRTWLSRIRLMGVLAEEDTFLLAQDCIELSSKKYKIKNKKVLCALG